MRLRYLIRSRTGIACALAACFALANAAAQQPSTRGAIHGRVVDQDGRPIVGAQITVMPGERHVVSDDDGLVEIVNLARATYTLFARRIGYQATSVQVAVRDSLVQTEIRMTGIPRQLDSIRVREKSSGLTFSAVVLDFNNLPVAGAEVVAMGVTNKIVTDSLGRFSVDRLSQTAVVIRLRKIGYRATLTSIRMLADRADTIRMPRLAQALSKVQINERSGFGMDYWAYRDMDQRQRWKNSTSGVISREELDAKGKEDLCDALPATASGVKLALHNDPKCKERRRMILLDGSRCVERSLADFTADEVEMVEVITGDDYSGSLAARNCGGGSPGVRAPARGRGGRIPDKTLGAALAVWMRKDEKPPVVPKPRAIAGIVFDSITQRPLAGAHIMIEDLKRETVADSLGAFHFDSVASGVHRLKADHETLEQLGLLSLRDTVDLVPELLTNVTLAIPSFATLWKRVCDDSIPPRATDGLVYGRVLLGPAAVASTDTSGTVVEASWRAFAPDSARDSDTRKQVPADSAGNYAVCGAPTTMPLTLSALSHGTATVSVSFNIGDVRIARRDLVLPASDIIDRLLADSSSVPPLPAGEGSTLSGIVRDSLGKPVKDARIDVTGVSGQWRTNEAGNFVVRGIPSGARVVASSQLGFLPERRLVDVGTADSIAVELSMSRVATFLDTMKVSGKQSLKTTALLDIASRRKLGIGYFEDSTKLAQLPGAGLRDAFNFPSTRTGQSGPGLWFIYMSEHAQSLTGKPGGPGGPGCTPAIFIDGMPSNIQFVNDMTKEEVGLIEAFTSPSRAPSEFAGSGGNCGIVLIWRKRYLRP